MAERLNTFSEVIITESCAQPQKHDDGGSTDSANTCNYYAARITCRKLELHDNSRIFSVLKTGCSCSFWLQELVWNNRRWMEKSQIGTKIIYIN